MSCKREAEEDKRGIFGCAEWSQSGAAAQGESNHRPCVWAARAVHPKALLFVFCTDLVKLVEKMTLVRDVPCKGKCRIQQKEKSVEFILGRDQMHHLGWLNPTLDGGNMLFLKWYLYL